MPIPVKHKPYPLSAGSEVEVNGGNSGGRYHDALHSSAEGYCGGLSTGGEGVLRRGRSIYNLILLL